MKQGRWLGFVLLLATITLAYANSFSVPFIFDDRSAIPHPANPHFSHLWQRSGPLLAASMLVNYRLGGVNVWGYHLFNLCVHLLAALTLYGIVRRTLLRPRLQPRYGAVAAPLALVISLLWGLHPLQTQSVTYIIQRAESLTGLCYLLTVYAAIRHLEQPRQRNWWIASVISCTLGMLCKPIMVTAPLIVWLYDQTLSILRPRLYLALGSTWAIPLTLWFISNQTEVGRLLNLPGWTRWQYGSAQPGVILYYLRLAVWPSPLVFDYAWRPPHQPEAVFLPMVVITGLIVATLWCVRRYPPLGFLGGWFFLILAPTSSIIPIADLIHERRMYLPLAAVVALATIAGYRALVVLFPTQERLRRRLAAGLVTLVVLSSIVATHRRNADFRSEVAIWSDTVAKRPDNSLAHSNLGLALARQGDFEGAIPHYRRAIELNPMLEQAYLNLVIALENLGRSTEAREYQAAAEQVRTRREQEISGRSSKP